MRRAIARLVEAPIAEMILRGELARGNVATVMPKTATSSWTRSLRALYRRKRPRVPDR